MNVIVYTILLKFSESQKIKVINIYFKAITYYPRLAQAFCVGENVL